MYNSNGLTELIAAFKALLKELVTPLDEMFHDLSESAKWFVFGDPERKE